jgi:hypothetical protein
MARRERPESAGGFGMSDRDYSPHQRKIIRRYYQNIDTLKSQRLAELVGEIYLAEGKKRERLWANVETTLRALGVPEARVAHLLAKRDPALLTAVLDELNARQP